MFQHQILIVNAFISVRIDLSRRRSRGKETAHIAKEPGALWAINESK